MGHMQEFSFLTTTTAIWLTNNPDDFRKDISFLLVQCIECGYALRFLASENHEACGVVCGGSHKVRDGRKDAMASYTDSGWGNG